LINKERSITAASLRRSMSSRVVSAAKYLWFDWPDQPVLLHGEKASGTKRLP
jgi:hypothetical protein